METDKLLREHPIILLATAITSIKLAEVALISAAEMIATNYPGEQTMLSLASDYVAASNSMRSRALQMSGDALDAIADEMVYISGCGIVRRQMAGVVDKIREDVEAVDYPVAKQVTKQITQARVLPRKRRWDS